RDAGLGRRPRGNPGHELRAARPRLGLPGPIVELPAEAALSAAQLCPRPGVAGADRARRREPQGAADAIVRADAAFLPGVEFVIRVYDSRWRRASANPKQNGKSYDGHRQSRVAAAARIDQRAVFLLDPARHADR